MHYEVEIKSLLGEEENALALKHKMSTFGAQLTSKNKQLNHYFVGSDLKSVHASLKKYLSQEKGDAFADLLTRVSDFSIRSRDKDGTVLFVLKASVDSTTSSNGITRIEFEEKIPMTLNELDQLLLEAGFAYQAKWSREREEYACRDAAICLDKNAGYGWLAEFEKVVNQESELEQARHDIQALMKECGVKELEQPRLERMFQFYNANWKDYYGTDKVFTIA
jgi:predicted adenylyl cyclase CyaB